VIPKCMTTQRTLWCTWCV